MNLLNILISILITVLNAYFVISKVSNKKYCLSTFMIFALIYIPFLYVDLTCLTGLHRIISTSFGLILATYLSIFRKDASSSIYYSFIYIFLNFILEIITSLILISIFKYNKNTYNNFEYSLLIFTLINTTIIFIISRFICVTKKLSDFKDSLSYGMIEKIYYFIIIILLLVFATNNYNKLKFNFDFYTNILVILFAIFTLILLLKNKNKKDELEDKYNESMEYVLRYEKIINEQGKKNHEYNNQLMVIKGYINKPERLSEYLDEVIGEHKTGQNYTVKQLGFLPDGGVKGLLYHKLSKMEDNNIKYYLYVDQNLKDKDIESFDLKTYRDLTKLLGVFLDNAIDAALKSEEKEIEVELKDKDDCLLLTISNTYDKNIDINKVGKSGFTTKGVGHGFGLSIVKDIAKTNSEIETFSSKESDKFIQTAMVYYKK